ncbi:hypothetical protein N780_01915 [Pontibacillus chungwhensis BH030062]|uniref:DUF3221 domain-containing protein n=1 Tax=Pontibacillus chungwhensis BH030062 TaxID=1385513 RepID=A0A0A2V071_9BACI|nr:YobA family protein [Pontibacillus chungwhensis]KGP92398.1 hypothetical protein N780_01915 [Pontibacillus chungwhensis BH030062]
MKKVLFLMSCLLLVNLLIVGCASSKDPESADVGYVMDKRGSRILVVDPNAKDVNNNGREDYYDAFWGEGEVKGVSIGDRVQVWIEDDVMLSYPAQAKISEIEIISREEPKGATLSESEALRKALSKTEDKMNVVDSITYIKEQNEWVVKLRNLLRAEDSVFKISVVDK